MYSGVGVTTERGKAAIISAASASTNLLLRIQRIIAERAGRVPASATASRKTLLFKINKNTFNALTVGWS